MLKIENNLINTDASFNKLWEHSISENKEKMLMKFD